VFYLAIWFFVQFFSGTLALAGRSKSAELPVAHIGGFVSGMYYAGYSCEGVVADATDESGMEWAWEPRRR